MGIRRRFLARSVVVAAVFAAAAVVLWPARAREAGREATDRLDAPPRVNAPKLRSAPASPPGAAGTTPTKASTRSQPLAQAGRDPRVSGRVVDDPSGAVVAGALIRAWDERGLEAVVRSARSDSRGEFTLDGVPTDLEVELIATAQDRAPRSFALLMGASRAGLEIRLEVGGVMEGEVRDAEGNLVADATVTALEPEEPLPPRRVGRTWYVFNAETERALALHSTGTSDARGHYEIRGVPLRKAVTAVVQPSRAPADRPWRAPPARSEARSAPATFTRPEEKIRRDVRMPGTGSLHVRFVHAPAVGKRPPQVDVTGATLWFSNDGDDCQEDGSCLFAAISPGPYEVLVWLRDAPPETRPVEIRPGERTTLDFGPALGRALEGLVVDEQGHPLVDAGAWWIGTKTIMGRTGEDGRFRLEGIPDAAGRLDIHAPHGFERDDAGGVKPARALVGTTLEGVVPGGALLRVVLKESPVVTGRLPGFPAGTQLRTQVFSKFLTAGNSRTLTEEGRFELPTGEADTRSFLLLEQPGFAPLVVDIPALVAGTRHDLGEMRFTNGRVVAGVVRGEDGQPFPGATVLVAEKWVEAQRATGADGSFRFERMPDRETELRVNAEGYPVHIVRIPAGGTPEKADIALDRGGVLQLRVVDAQGEPVPLAKIVFMPDGDYPYDRDYDKTRRHAEADAQGRLEAHVQARGHRIQADDPQWRAKGELESVRVGSGETKSVEIRLR